MRLTSWSNACFKMIEHHTFRTALMRHCMRCGVQAICQRRAVHDGPSAKVNDARNPGLPFLLHGTSISLHAVSVINESGYSNNIRLYGYCNLRFVTFLNPTASASPVLGESGGEKTFSLRPEVATGQRIDIAERPEGKPGQERL